MENLKEYLAAAQQLLAGKEIDKDVYGRIESFVLKNGAKLRKEPLFQDLKKALGEVARKFNLPSLESLQEGFGLNSCAQ